MPTMEHLGLTTCVDEHRRPWVDSRPGIRSQLLSVCAATGTWVLRNRFAPGYTSPPHHHTGGVHAFTHTGHWRYQEYDWVAGPGSYVHEGAGGRHTLIIPPDNTGEVEITFVIDGGNVNFTADGDYIDMLDGIMMLKHYLQKCQEQGFDRPDGILV